MRPIPKAMRAELAKDPFYLNCIRRTLLQDHDCRPNPVTKKLIEWEHPIYFANKQVNEKWCIIPICWYAHQGGIMVKEINVWIALNRATDDELKQYSKAENLIAKRDRLNKKYGEAKILRGK